MIRFLFFFLLFPSYLALAEDYSVGSLSLSLSSEYLVENNGEDTLLAFINDDDMNPLFFLNVQLASLSDLENGDIIVSSDALTDMLEEIRAIAHDVENIKSVTEKGYSLEMIYGHVIDADSFDYYFYAAELKGEMYNIYFSLLDTRSKTLATEMYLDILAQINENGI